MAKERNYSLVSAFCCVCVQAILVWLGPRSPFMGIGELDIMYRYKLFGTLPMLVGIPLD